MLLENVRFPAKMDPNNEKFKSDDERNDSTLSQNLGRLGDLFVNDAFGTAHRANSSTEGVTKYLQPAVAGFLMQKELDYMGKASITRTGLLSRSWEARKSRTKLGLSRTCWTRPISC